MKQINSAAFAAAPIGNYLELNGGYVTSNTFPNSPSEFAFDAWIKPHSVNGIQKIISIGDMNTGKLHYEVGINGGSLSFKFNYSTSSQTSMTAGNIEQDVWTHISVVVNSQITRMSVNHTSVISLSGVTGLRPIGNTIVLGGSFTKPSGNPDGFKGAIDEVRIDDGFLFWHLDETRGQTTAMDSSGNNLNGQLVGGDSKIHFFGILPSPTPTPTKFFALPTIRWNRPTLPTLGFGDNTDNGPTPTLPENNNPSPTSTSLDIRSNRPVYPR